MNEWMNEWAVLCWPQWISEQFTIKMCILWISDQFTIGMHNWTTGTRAYEFVQIKVQLVALISISMFVLPFKHWWSQVLHEVFTKDQAKDMFIQKAAQVHHALLVPGPTWTLNIIHCSSKRLTELADLLLLSSLLPITRCCPQTTDGQFLNALEMSLLGLLAG